jgi:hypothetical protein
VERKYIQLRLPAAGLKYHTLAWERERECWRRQRAKLGRGIRYTQRRLLIIACTFATGGVRDFEINAAKNAVKRDNLISGTRVLTFAFVVWDFLWLREEMQLQIAYARIVRKLHIRNKCAINFESYIVRRFLRLTF